MLVFCKLSGIMMTTRLVSYPSSLTGRTFLLAGLFVPADLSLVVHSRVKTLGVSPRFIFMHIILSRDRGAFACVPVHDESGETGEDGGCAVRPPSGQV